MRGFVTSMACMLGLVGVAMQFERPTATAGLAEVTTKAPSHEVKAAAPALTTEQRAAAAAELKSISAGLDDIENRIGAPAATTTEPVQYVTKKVCRNGVCRLERVPIVGALRGTTRSNCDCGCGCSNCNCGMQPVQQIETQQAGDPVRRGLFGRRSGRLFGGRLFGGRMGGGRLFGGGCCR